MKKRVSGRRVTRRTFISASAELVAVAAGAHFFPVSLLGQGAAMEADALFIAAAEVIIPPSGRMPSAGDAGSMKYFQARVREEPKLAKRLSSTLFSINELCRERSKKLFASAPLGIRVETLKHFEAKSADLFAELRDIVYESYYTDPEIWRLIGYHFRSGPGRTAQLESFNEKLLDHVKKMPARYRKVEG
jgi:hypothetical protein